MVTPTPQSDDFWSGIRLAVRGLSDAAGKASYTLGLGAGGLGGVLWVLTGYGSRGITSPETILLSLSAFFISASVGKWIDNYSDRRALKANLDAYFEIEKRIQEAIAGLEDSERVRELKEIAGEQRKLILKENRKLLDDMKGTTPQE